LWFILLGQEYIFLLRKFHTCAGACTVPYSVDTGAEFPGVKRPGREAILSLSIYLSSEVQNERIYNSLACTGVDLHFVNTCLCNAEGKHSVLMNLKLLEGLGHRQICEIYRHFPGGAEDRHKKTLGRGVSRSKIESHISGIQSGLFPLRCTSQSAFASIYLEFNERR